MDNNKKNDRQLDPESKLKEVYSVWGPAEAEVIKSFLESNGIKCLMKGLVVQSVHPFSADGLGEIKIFVAEKDYDVAKKLISDTITL
ncbi:MAG: DUF2007 domain-containing protein [Candidatus Aminicenantaceae bacterium]